MHGCMTHHTSAWEKKKVSGVFKVDHQYVNHNKSPESLPFACRCTCKVPPLFYQKEPCQTSVDTRTDFRANWLRLQMADACHLLALKAQRKQVKYFCWWENARNAAWEATHLQSLFESTICWLTTVMNVITIEDTAHCTANGLKRQVGSQGSCYCLTYRTERGCKTCHKRLIEKMVKATKRCEQDILERPPTPFWVFFTMYVGSQL